MNAVLYARVSSERQADKDLSIPAQLEAMREYARARDWTISEEFLEPGASARTNDRPALRRMLARCKQEPRVNVVLVHKVDRLARDVYGHATIKALLKQRDIRLASVVENVDDTITGQLVENIMASIAEFYSANLGEEVKKGMRIMVQRGEWPHLPPRGYRLTRTGQGRPQAVPFDEESVPIAEAFRLYGTGRFSLRDIGEELLIRGITTAKGKPLPLSYVRKVLENPFYCGRLRWNGTDFPGKHAPIVSESLFLEVQEVLRRRFKRPGERGRIRFLLRGLATCGDCGHLMTAERHKNRWSYYRCIEHAHGRCRSRPSNASEAHSALLRIYRTLHLSPEWKDAIRREASAECDRRAGRNEAEIAALRRKHERLLGRELRLTEAFTAGDVSPNSYRALGNKLRTEIATVEETLRAPRAAPAELMERIDGLLAAAESLAALHESLDLPRQQVLLSLVFRKLVLDGGRIVEHSLRPPFDVIFPDPADHGGAGQPVQPGPPGSTSSSEQRYPAPAIESLFEWDISNLDTLVSPTGPAA